jgi:methylated-DNA-protein-cysteine methyltransferase related protein
MAAKKNKTGAKSKPVTITPSGKRQESFFELVHQVVRQIPRGRVSSYGAIAKCLGSGLSARMVGWAMNAAHDPKLKVPAHRVVNRNGMLSGKMHFGNADEMQRLLEKEKIKVVNDQVQDFAKVYWEPGEE